MRVGVSYLTGGGASTERFYIRSQESDETEESALRRSRDWRTGPPRPPCTRSALTSSDAPDPRLIEGNLHQTRRNSQYRLRHKTDQDPSTMEHKNHHNLKQGAVGHTVKQSHMECHKGDHKAEHGADHKAEHGVQLGVPHGVQLGVKLGAEHGVHHKEEHKSEHGVQLGVNLGVGHGIQLGVGHGVQLGVGHGVQHREEHRAEHGVQLGVGHGVHHKEEHKAEHGVKFAAMGPGMVLNSVSTTLTKPMLMDL
ncbi:uncharacterized protein RB166_006267 [Leptodactylus fuscus]|uniref:uncharacterized protein LOC142201105 n=1 Tax=Leptodactylus fuscus TaxID=238119 RepID=UPI003F4EAE76